MRTERDELYSRKSNLLKTIKPNWNWIIQRYKRIRKKLYTFHLGSKGYIMVLTLDGISDIGAHVRRNLCYLICLRLLIRSRVVTNRFFSPKICIFLYARASFTDLPSNISSMGPAPDSQKGAASAPRYGVYSLWKSH